MLSNETLVYFHPIVVTRQEECLGCWYCMLVRYVAWENILFNKDANVTHEYCL